MINNPSQDIILPADITKAIEGAKNNVTLLEAEQLRLRGLIASEEYTISQLHNSKTELSEQVRVLQREADELKTKIIALKKEEEEATKSYKNVVESVKNLDEEIRVKKENLKEQENVLETNIFKYNEDKALLETQKALVESEARELNRKTEALKGIIN